MWIRKNNKTCIVCSTGLIFLVRSLGNPHFVSEGMCSHKEIDRDRGFVTHIRTHTTVVMASDCGCFRYFDPPGGFCPRLAIERHTRLNTCI